LRPLSLQNDSENFVGSIYISLRRHKVYLSQEKTNDERERSLILRNKCGYNAYELKKMHYFLFLIWQDEKRACNT
jgi:hypothetical protein